MVLSYLKLKQITLGENILLNNGLITKKVQVENDQEKAHSEEISTLKTEVGNTKLTVRYLYLENIS